MSQIWNLGCGGTGAGVLKLSGDGGIDVFPNGAGLIDITGAGGLTVVSNPGTNSLTITNNNVASGFTADDTNTVHPLAGILKILGGNANIQTTAVNVNEIKVNLSNNVTLSGNLQAANVTATNNLTATQNIVATLGDITATAGSIYGHTGNFSDSVIINNLGGTAIHVLHGPVKLDPLGAGVVQVDGTTHNLFSNNGAVGQVLIGGGLAPAWRNIVEGAGILITNADNAITIETSNIVAQRFHTNAGNATPVAWTLNVLGGTNINTAGAGSTVTVNLDDDVTIGNTLNVTGTSFFHNDVRVTGSILLDPIHTIDSTNGDILFLNSADIHTDFLRVLNGIDLQYAHNGVLQTDNVGAVTANNGVDGTVYTGKGAGVTPAFRTLTAGAGIAITTTAADITIAATGAATHPSFFAFLNPEMNVSGNNVTHLIGSVTATTINYNIGGLFFPGDGAGTPASFTAATAGTYVFTANIGMRNNAASGGTEFRWSLALNGVNWYAGSSFPTRRRCAGFYGTSGHITTSGSTLMRLAPGDIVTLRFISAGGAQADSVIDGSFAGALLF
jgi:hypothetical protein